LHLVAFASMLSVRMLSSLLAHVSTLIHTSLDQHAALLLYCCAGVVSWWCGLVGALHEKPEEWRAEASFAALPTLLASINQQYWQHSVRGSRPGQAGLHHGILWHTTNYGILGCGQASGRSGASKQLSHMMYACTSKLLQYNSAVFAGFVLSDLMCTGCCSCCAYILKVSNNWAALQRLLVRCVLPSLGAQQASQQHLGIVPGGGLKDLGGAPLPAQQVRSAVTELATLVTGLSSAVCQMPDCTFSSKRPPTRVHAALACTRVGSGIWCKTVCAQRLPLLLLCCRAMRCCLRALLSARHLGLCSYTSAGEGGSKGWCMIF
jgi:hypothetical protein